MFHTGETHAEKLNDLNSFSSLPRKRTCLRRGEVHAEKLNDFMYLSSWRMKRTCFRRGGIHGCLRLEICQVSRAGGEAKCCARVALWAAGAFLGFSGVCCLRLET